jgi:putative ABC transport system permease protein
VFARLKPGVPIARARADMALIASRLEEKYPQLDRTWRSTVFPLSAEDMGADMRRTLLVLECAVAFVLLIACANVINLQLTRAAAREKEMAVRVALGAGRWRMARQMLGESLLLSALGGGAGILLAHWAIAGMVALAPADIHHLNDLTIDGGVLAFTLAITVLTGLLFGLAPAILAALPGSQRRPAPWRDGRAKAVSPRASAARWWWPKWRSRWSCWRAPD